jgi:hypothetical protein
MVKYIDEQHSEGRSVMNKKVLNWFRQEQGVVVSRRAVQHKLQDLGLSWSKVKPCKRTLCSFSLKAIRDYLIALWQVSLWHREWQSEFSLSRTSCTCMTCMY